jgi:beta-glucanase (GH16 family)
MKNRLPIFILVIFQIILLNACKKESVTPDIKFTSSVFTVIEDNPSASVEIPVKLSGTSDEAISLDYITEDSTALAGKDYAAVTAGKLTFQPGETSKAIEVDILSDTAQKRDVYFRIILSNPVNAVLTVTRVTVKIINVDYANLVWSDEFNTASLNTGIWNYETGAGGWGNNELQTYTNSLNNVHIDSGYLHITALNPSSAYYTSGRITTMGKKEFTWGRVNIRAKLPQGKGIWPALWMLGANYPSVGWVKCGEIDIMELLGQASSVVYGTAHWDNNGYLNRSNSFTLSGSSFSSGFHTFSLVWTPNQLKWLVDNYEFFNLSRSEINTFPFDLPQFFIFNIAVGGNWPGSPDQTTIFPQHMIVDYIRIYQ